MPTRDEAPPLSVTNVSGTSSPDGQGDSTSGSNNTGNLDSIGPVFAEQVTTIVSFFGTNTSLFVTFTLHSSLGVVVLMRLIKASTFSCFAFGRLELRALSSVSSWLLRK